MHQHYAISASDFQIETEKSCFAIVSIQMLLHIATVHSDNDTLSSTRRDYVAVN